MYTMHKLLDQPNQVWLPMHSHTIIRLGYSLTWQWYWTINTAAWWCVPYIGYTANCLQQKRKRHKLNVLV